MIKRIETPIISIVIPLFNRESLIRQTLDSLLKQTFQEWECIIVDDHSQDNSYNAAERYVDLDNRFRVYLRPDKMKKGANSCRNYGLLQAKGKFIYWLDSDDIPHPKLLEYSFKCLNDSNYDYVRFNRTLFFGEFKPEMIEAKELLQDRELRYSPSLIESMLLNDLEFNTCNVVWRKTSLNNEGFCEDIVYADEWEFYSRLLMLELRGINLKNVLIYGRKHKASTTAEFRTKDPLRVNSKIKAAKMVLLNLINKNIFTSGLKKYFLRMAFELKSYQLINLSLKADRAGIGEKLKYRIGYFLYPLLKPVFHLKAKMIKN